MNLSEGSGAGSVPAPAPQEEAPAPLANWQTLLGLTPSEPKKIQISKRISSPNLGKFIFGTDIVVFCRSF